MTACGPNPARFVRSSQRTPEAVALINERTWKTESGIFQCVQEASHNPYTPPSAHVAQQETSLREVRAPVQVTCAVLLYVFSYVLFTIVGFFQARPTSTTTSGPVGGGQVILIACAVLTLYFSPFWLLYKAAKRRSWGRLALTLMSAIGAPALLLGAAQDHDLQSWRWQCLLGTSVLEAVALALLFVPAVNRWYREEN